MSNRMSPEARSLYVERRFADRELTVERHRQRATKANLVERFAA